MSNRVCGRCKSANIVEIGSYGGSTYYHCENCKDWGEKDSFPEMTVFDQITASPKVLAKEFVLSVEDPDYPFESILTGLMYKSYEEAFAATIKELERVIK